MAAIGIATGVDLAAPRDLDLPWAADSSAPSAKRTDHSSRAVSTFVRLPARFPMANLLSSTVSDAAVKAPTNSGVTVAGGPAAPERSASVSVAPDSRQPAAPIPSQDREEREVTRRLRAQYAEISQLAGGLAHEIRNPLSTLQLNLDLLAEDFQDAETPRDRRVSPAGRAAPARSPPAAWHPRELPPVRPHPGPEAGSRRPERDRRRDSRLLRAAPRRRSRSSSGPSSTPISRRSGSMLTCSSRPC